MYELPCQAYRIQTVDLTSKPSFLMQFATVCGFLPYTSILYHLMCSEYVYIPDIILQVLFAPVFSSMS